MKKKLTFYLGLILLILVTTVAPAAVKPAKIVNGVTKLNKSNFSKKSDYYYFYVAYSATLVSTGVYDLKVYLLAGDETTGIYTAYPAPATLTITMTSGPFSGSPFQIPSGQESVDFGNFSLSSAPTGSVSATMNPSVLGGITVIPDVFNLNDLLSQ